MGSINFSEAKALERKIFVDVRTPLEFSHDHIAGAINIPILSNEQRALVGTIYKNESQKKAVDTGVKFFSEKLPGIVERLREFEGRQIIAYCWRGGMRSKAFVSFLKSLNFDIVQLEGGYKAFRKEVREALYNFDIKPKVFCIYGMTGSGKTDMIEMLMPKSIDLERLAGHRSSIFGHVGLNPKSQKMFENMLLSELLRVNNMPYFFFEGESRKVGNINIPESVFNKMTSATPIKVISDLNVRAKRIVAEYFDSDDKIREISTTLDSHVLSNRLGKKTVCHLKECLKNGEYVELSAILLEKYYDPIYLHSQKRLKGTVEINCDDIDEAVRNIKEYAINEAPNEA
jgi:tRNA 2-selenouridine synthase